MKNILIICVSICALFLIGCGGGKNSNAVVIGGVTFDKTKSIATADAEWTSGNTYNYIGGGDLIGWTAHNTLDDGYTVHGVPCIRESSYMVSPADGTLATTYYYYADGTDGHTYILKEDDTIYVTPQIYLHKDIGTITTTWENEDAITGDVYTFVTTGLSETSPVASIESTVTLLHTSVDTVGTITYYASDNLIPLEIIYDSYGVSGGTLVTGYFYGVSMTSGTLVAPAGNG